MRRQPMGKQKESKNKLELEPLGTSSPPEIFASQEQCTKNNFGDDLAYFMAFSCLRKGQHFKRETANKGPRRVPGVP